MTNAENNQIDMQHATCNMQHATCYNHFLIFCIQNFGKQSMKNQKIEGYWRYWTQPCNWSTEIRLKLKFHTLSKLVFLNTTTQVCYLKKLWERVCFLNDLVSIRVFILLEVEWMLTKCFKEREVLCRVISLSIHFIYKSFLLLCGNLWKVFFFLTSSCLFVFFVGNFFLHIFIFCVFRVYLYRLYRS